MGRRRELRCPGRSQNHNPRLSHLLPISVMSWRRGAREARSHELLESFRGKKNSVQLHRRNEMLIVFSSCLPPAQCLVSVACDVSGRKREWDFNPLLLGDSPLLPLGWGRGYNTGVSLGHSR